MAFARLWAEADDFYRYHQLQPWKALMSMACFVQTHVSARTISWCAASESSEILPMGPPSSEERSARSRWSWWTRPAPAPRPCDISSSGTTRSQLKYFILLKLVLQCNAICSSPMYCSAFDWWSLFDVPDLECDSEDLHAGSDYGTSLRCPTIRWLFLGSHTSLLPGVPRSRFWRFSEIIEHLCDIATLCTQNCIPEFESIHVRLYDACVRTKQFLQWHHTL